MKRKALVVSALITLIAAATAAFAGVGSAAKSSSQAIRCNSTMKIAMVTPLTGVAGFLGSEQLTWAKYAVKTLPSKFGLKVRLLSGDTPVEQGPAPAQALAQKFVADSQVVGIIGPSTSGAAAASSQAYFDGGIAHVSPSATRTSLTKSVDGKPKEATPGFFRVVPDDGIQGPYDANFMVKTLKAKKVVIFDFQEPYSLGLAGQVEQSLKKAGVDTSRQSVANTVTDFASFVTKISADTDVVFFPTQAPPAAQNFAQQLAEQGKKAKVFGGDGANNPDQFKFPGSYVSNFAAPIDLFPYNKSIIDGWKKDNSGSDLGSFGPPTYGAVQVLLTAIKAACTKAGNGSIDRRAVIKQVKKVRISNWILGGNFRFSTKTNDPLNGKFYIFEIQSNGSYKLIG
ncbi:MAG: branched-chain amino acid ABC transporter substrate-binding protein [Gaiella sp.]